jgi:hypothetical protein
MMPSDDEVAADVTAAPALGTARVPMVVGVVGTAWAADGQRADRPTKAALARSAAGTANRPLRILCIPFGTYLRKKRQK